MADRQTWDDTWFAVAAAMARRSLCVRAQVGAVIVDTQHRVVATGYNGAPRGFQHFGSACSLWCPRSMKDPGEPIAPDYDDCISLHAEANAISVAGIDARDGGTIYVTGHVCFGCAKLIANSGISYVDVLPDGDRAYRDPGRSYDLLRDCGVRVRIVDSSSSQ